MIADINKAFCWLYHVPLLKNWYIIYKVCQQTKELKFLAKLKLAWRNLVKSWSLGSPTTTPLSSPTTQKLDSTPLLKLRIVFELSTKKPTTADKVAVNKFVRENIQSFIQFYIQPRFTPIEKVTKDPHNFVSNLN